MAIVVGSILILLNLAFLSPPYHALFVWQRRIRALVLTLYGFANLLFGLPSLFARYLPGFAVAILQVQVYAFLPILLGFAMEWLWKRRWWLKLIVLLLLAVSSYSFGGFAVAFGHTLVEKADLSCEHFFSDSNGMRIVRYSEKGVIPGAHFFFLSTTNGGKTWRQAMHFRHDDQIAPHCENIRFFGPDHYSVWMGWKLAVTRNGGKSWRVWYPNETWPEWQCCNYRLIEDVEFEDALRGRMTLNPIGQREPASELFTEDGGESWREG